jgi:hypothetical protein
MLNELSEVVAALERAGIVTASRHPRINPMGKNRELLVVRLDDKGKPTDVEFIAGDKAASLFRVEHGSAGSSFPGFNVPAPLLSLTPAPAGQLKSSLEQLCALWRRSSSPIGQILDSIKRLVSSSEPRQFAASQCKQFERSVFDLVLELEPLFAKPPTDLANFARLLQVVGRAKLTLPTFCQDVTEALCHAATTADREALLLIQGALLGVLDWKRRSEGFGSAGYWSEKAELDKNANQPIYLDLASPDRRNKPVAHPQTSEAVNAALLRAANATPSTAPKQGGAMDAFGRPGQLQDKFPAPKIAELGNLKLYSVNTSEVQALLRYGLRGAEQFPASAEFAQRMNDALLYLADEKKKGVTCQAIPSALPDKRDLLIAYLEEAPDFGGALADLFGGEAQTFSDADFAARTRPVLEALEGRLRADPSLKVRLLALCSLDKGRKQISLQRQFRVRDIVRAARAWKAGAANSPPVSIWFYDKRAKATVWKAQLVPHPLDVSSVINRVWSSDAKAGFTASFQRAVTAFDAYDVFFADGPLSAAKSSLCLSLLLDRMASVLSRLGAVTTSRDWTALSEAVRWQCAKSVSLLGIFLRQLGHSKDSFMKDSIAQIGRLLALADSLHQHYCRHVRNGETPTQLIGNALFSTALERPVFALARLGERLAPYQAWARTFQSNDQESGIGLVKYFLAEIADCTGLIQLSELPARMGDADKAKLLLGYLADRSKRETQTKQPKTADST